MGLHPLQGSYCNSRYSWLLDFQISSLSKETTNIPWFWICPHLELVKHTEVKHTLTRGSGLPATACPGSTEGLLNFSHGPLIGIELATLWFQARIPNQQTKTASLWNQYLTYTEGM